MWKLVENVSGRGESEMKHEASWIFKPFTGFNLAWNDIKTVAEMQTAPSQRLLIQFPNNFHVITFPLFALINKCLCMHGCLQSVSCIELLAGVVYECLKTLADSQRQKNGVRKVVQAWESHFSPGEKENQAKKRKWNEHLTIWCWLVKHERKNMIIFSSENIRYRRRKWNREKSFSISGQMATNFTSQGIAHIGAELSLLHNEISFSLSTSIMHAQSHFYWINFSISALRSGEYLMVPIM